MRSTPGSRLGSRVESGALGAEIGRFATINDLHIGEPAFGVLPRLAEDRGRHASSYSVRAARAAIDEAVAWGAEAVVVKGDITWSGRPIQWEQAGQVLGACPVPLAAIVGNHDVPAGSQPGRPWLEASGAAVVVDGEGPTATFEIAGVTAVLVHTATGPGRTASIEPATAEAAATAANRAGRSIVFMHHYIDRFAVATRFPRGVDHQSGDAFLRTLASIEHPPALVSTGHSHRHRRYRRHGLEISEVGSTKDYPGVWAGYIVHEGGLRQTVHRIMEPTVVDWTDRTANTCLGLWGRWTPGRAAWRDFSVRWPGGLRTAG